MEVDSSTQGGRASSRLGQKGVFDLYATITDQVMAALDAGVVPWRSPILGCSGAGYPRNLNSGKPYCGVNVFLLAFTAWAKGYDSSYWLSFKQAQERGGNVKKGEKSSMVVFWKPLEVTDPKTGEKEKRFVLRYYNVFNVKQTEGIDMPDAPKWTPTEFNPIAEAEKIVAGYANPPEIVHGGSQAFYRPRTDTVQLPEPTRFTSNEEYYGTAFHELAHSTGHSKRLDRKIDTDPKPFGTPDYGREELVAEMGAAFLCGHAGILPVVVQNSAAYISGWLGQLKADKKLVVAAAGQAQRAADHILGVKFDVAQEEPTVQTE
jgi:antirestriction protein ArdC